MTRPAHTVANNLGQRVSALENILIVPDLKSLFLEHANEGRYKRFLISVRVVDKDIVSVITHNSLNWRSDVPNIPTGKLPDQTRALAWYCSMHLHMLLTVEDSASVF